MSQAEIIGPIVNECDPIRLLVMGCPDDEYDQEIRLLEMRTTELKESVESARAVLVEIFEAQFFPNFLQPEQAAHLAERLFAALNEGSH